MVLTRTKPVHIHFNLDLLQHEEEPGESKVANGVPAKPAVISKVSPWLVSSEVVSAPVTKINSNEMTIVRKSVITTQL